MRSEALKILKRQI